MQLDLLQPSGSGGSPKRASGPQSSEPGSGIPPSVAGIGAAVRLLESSGDFRIVRRMTPRVPRPDVMPRADSGVRLAVILDVETTGLDVSRHEIVELGMLAVSYDDGGIRELVGVFEGLRQPSIPLPREIATLTGLTDRMLRGRSIDPAAVADFAGAADLVIAHNARFDRPFCERLFPVFRDRAWACSAQDVPWKRIGVDGARLGHVLAAYGLFHDGHRALADCHAVLECLARTPPGGGRPAFLSLVESASETSVEIRAVGSPFHTKDTLKARGYRWLAPANGGSTAWTITVADHALEEELGFLRTSIYRDKNLTLPTRRLDARSRYRS